LEVNSTGKNFVELENGTEGIETPIFDPISYAESDVRWRMPDAGCRIPYARFELQGLITDVVFLELHYLSVSGMCLCNTTLVVKPFYQEWERRLTLSTSSISSPIPLPKTVFLTVGVRKCLCNHGLRVKLCRSSTEQINDDHQSLQSIINSAVRDSIS
jgi:hypothetical protein